MSNFIETLKDLIHNASEVHQRERKITMDSVVVCGRLYQFRAHVQVGMTMEDFARRIGLSPDVYAKRAKAAQIMKRFPRVLRMVESGELAISSVAAIYPKITEANQKTLLDAVANKPKREVERLLARITPAGEWIAGEGDVELRLVLKESDLKKIERAREVLSHGGKVPVTVEVLMKAIEDLLERRDPIRKAERAVGRVEGRGVAGDEEVDGAVQVTRRPGAARPSVPARVRHQVMLRDQGQCTWTHPDGTRCPERLNIEYDHITPWRDGGEHSVGNLRILCRMHNAHRAEIELGRPLRECG